MSTGSNRASTSTPALSSSLEVKKLHSYSPTWPYLVRLTLAMAVQYACMRSIERAKAIHQLLNPSGNKTESFDADDQEDDLVIRDDDGNIKARLEGWDRKYRIRKDGELVTAWKEYCEKFIIATCQHLGVLRETLPPGPITLEDIRSASRGRTISEDRILHATQYEMGTSYILNLHEGTGQRVKEIIDSEKRSSNSVEMSTEKQKEKNSMGKSSERKGGSLDDEEFRGREIELVNELILVALGLGQHRGEDGSTTLFEQEAIFGELEEGAVEQEISSKDGDKVRDDIASQEPRSATLTAGGIGTKAWQAATSTFGRSSKRDSSRFVHSQEDIKAGAPMKPNEPCHYDARARAIIFVAITALGVDSINVCMAEKVLAQTIYFILSEGRNASVKQENCDLLNDAKGEENNIARQKWMNQSSQDAVTKEKGKVNWGRYLATGAGVAVGGAIIGLTGGLAAPIIAPALVGLTGSAFLATTGGIVMIGTLLGVTGGGLAGYKVQQRLRGIDYFEFKEVTSTAREAGMEIPSLHATICCSGLLLKTDKQGAAFNDAFHQVVDSRDAYTIQAEEAKMKEAGEGLKGYVIDTAIRTGGRKVGEEVIKHTALAGLAALALPLTIWGTASAALDGVFVQAKSRAYRAGLILADVLKDQVQGHRPVILIGTSLGCVTILTALGELAKSPEENMHIVDSVYLIGAPMTPSPGTLRRARSITARRFVNAYHEKDMVCSIAAWLGSGISLEELRGGLMPRVMGSQSVIEVPGVDNIDIGDLTKGGGHFSLNQSNVLSAILKRCNAME